MTDFSEQPAAETESFDDALTKAFQESSKSDAADIDLLTPEADVEKNEYRETAENTAAESLGDAAQTAANAANAAAAGELEAEADSADSEYRARLRKFTRELKKKPGQWYIIQCYSGYENKVKANLDMRVQTLEVEDNIYETVVPVEQVTEIKDGKRKLVKRKLLPGYVLVRMDIDDRSWSVVRETPGVTSFVGNEGNATPVKHRDVAKFLLPQEAASGEAMKVSEGEQVVEMPEAKNVPKHAINFEVGEAVTILTGALASVSATISSIDQETGKIQALVSIFGRETPVELTADQVEKVM
ncbi:transcription termination/antitermination protein NusG [Corynebacterium caspium]|uniref:transcription termination/antitermination protein NusG n=1 Tax=Corynebacterium caspium TaxID=234828 RepID=UPI000367C522|nr:transcription termination/antitermination protein NusG [Corynebacterium caspium]WKD59871.1 hypothetical protein CCASP_07460 [Corynebacterium caspium DSM 44850]